MSFCCSCTLWLGGIFLAYVLVRWAFATIIKAPNLKGKAVLITGCDSGFGKAAAEQLAAKFDFKVLAACLTDAGVQALKTKTNVVPFLMDVTKDESVAAGIEFVKKEAPNGLWAVLNNAGLLRGGLLEIATIDSWKIQFEVNVFGMVRVTKATLPLVRKAEGRIINVASVAGRFTIPGSAAYSATKYAVESLSDALRREAAESGVKVVIIEPGVMKTNLWDVPFDAKTHAEQWNAMTKEQQEYYGKDFLEKSYAASKKQILGMASDPQVVVDGMINAITSRIPYIRYTLGKDAFAWLLFATVPALWMDLLFKKMAEKEGVVPAGLKGKKKSA